jgi:hypothetical protein
LHTSTTPPTAFTYDGDNVPRDDAAHNDDYGTHAHAHDDGAAHDDNVVADNPAHDNDDNAAHDDDADTTDKRFVRLR